MPGGRRASLGPVGDMAHQCHRGYAPGRESVRAPAEPGSHRPLGTLAKDSSGKQWEEMSIAPGGQSPPAVPYPRLTPWWCLHEGASRCVGVGGGVCPPNSKHPTAVPPSASLQTIPRELVFLLVSGALDGWEGIGAGKPVRPVNQGQTNLAASRLSAAPLWR